MREQETFLEKHRELLTYVVSGVSAVILNWCIYAMLIGWMPMVIANTLSLTITLAFAFLTNKVFVFRSLSFRKEVLTKDVVAFIASRGITSFIELVAQPQLYELGMNRPLFGVDGLEAKITVCLAISIINYLSTKLLVFGSGRQKRHISRKGMSTT